MVDEDEERRGLDRRVFEFERKMEKLLTTLSVTESKVDGLMLAMDSRHKAFERGQDLILDRLKPLAIIVEQNLDARLTDIEVLKNKAEGALLMMQVLGVRGVVGGIVAIVRMISE